MSYILVEDFRYGLDTRKSAITAPPGTLRELRDGQVTRGGEIEKAKKMVAKYALPTTAATGTLTLTGGSSGSVNSVTVDGDDILGGAVPYITSLNATAAAVATKINNGTVDTGYSAAAVGAVVTITAPTDLGSSVNGFVVASTRTTLTASHVNMSGGAEHTFGLMALSSDLYVFGSLASPGTIPAGITYQRLIHPDSSSIKMSSVLSTEVFNSKIYVVAEFENGDVFHYYDGALATDWGAGLVRSGMTNNSGIAAHLAPLINADAAVNAAAVGAVITITAVTAGVAFTISSVAENKTGGTNNQTAVVATSTPAVAGVAETLASCVFTVTGGTPNTAATGNVTLTGGASGSVDGITVNGVQIMSAAVPFNTDLNTTAADVASNINAFASSPEYTAAAVGAVVTITAATAAGADVNGFVVTPALTTITASSANMSGGVTNAVTSVKVDGIEVLNSRINWTASHSTVAANIAAQIVSYTSSPDYSATSTNAAVTVKGVATSGATPNGKVVAVTVAGSVTVAVTGGTMAGGVNAVSGQAQVSTVTIGGTFEAGDKFTVLINDYPYGYSSRPTIMGRILLTLKRKMYFGADENLYFSAVGLPANLSTEDTGAGFINMSNEAPKFEKVTGLASYFNSIAVFAKRVIQVWTIDADPTKNAQAQIIPNSGTFASKSVKGMSEGEVIYLDRPGIRALKAHGYYNFATTSEIGTAIDEEISVLIKSLSENEKSRAVATIEPLDNRYWLAISDRIYVFSFFSGSKVSAWSQHAPELVFRDFATIDDFLYGRADNTVYLYGGNNGDEYVGAGSTVITLPFLDAKSPGTEKNFSGMDVGVQGQWLVEAATDPEQPNVFDPVMNVDAETFTMQRIPFEGKSTHISVRFTSLDDQYGKISNLAIHYDGGEAD